VKLWLLLRTQPKRFVPQEHRGSMNLLVSVQMIKTDKDSKRTQGPLQQNTGMDIYIYRLHMAALL
jgi:hypothetical protein